MKGLAEYHDMTLGDLIEGVMLHAFEGKPPFGRESMKKIADLKKIYGLELGSSDAHRMGEQKTKARK